MEHDIEIEALASVLERDGEEAAAQILWTLAALRRLDQGHMEEHPEPALPAYRVEELAEMVREVAAKLHPDRPLWLPGRPDMTTTED